jgi:hypothetical protein
MSHEDYHTQTADSINRNDSKTPSSDAQGLLYLSRLLFAGRLKGVKA